MLNFFMNIVYNISKDGKLNIIRTDYTHPDIGMFLATKWMIF